MAICWPWHICNLQWEKQTKKHIFSFQYGKGWVITSTWAILQLAWKLSPGQLSPPIWEKGLLCLLFCHLSELSSFSSSLGFSCGKAAVNQHPLFLVIYSSRVFQNQRRHALKVWTMSMLVGVAQYSSPFALLCSVWHCLKWPCTHGG